MNKFKIIIPFYNASKFLDGCINSVLSQKYDNYQAIFIDDASTDDSWEKLPHGHEKAICIKNDVNLTALENIHNAIFNHCEPQDLVCLLDGDDTFSNKNVLSYLNDFYNNPENNDPWIVYGSCSWTDGRTCFSTPYLEKEFDNIRSSPFRISHLRTFRAGLYQSISMQDTEFLCMKDSDKNFYRCTYDVAIMFPMLEMSGFDRVKHNSKVLYIYNRNNPISDDKVRQQLQWSIHDEISRKPKFNKIESFK